MNLQPLPANLIDNGPVSAAWDRYRSLVGQLAAGLLGLDDDYQFEIWGTSGGNWVGETSAQDFRHKFANMSWSLTLNEYHNGGVGQVVSIWSDPVYRTGWLSAEQEIKADSFLQYANLGDAGLYYLAAHETAHVSALGLATGEKCAADYRQRTGATTYDAYANTYEWSYNEAVANIIAKRVCDRLSLPILANPRPVGYSVPLAPNWLHAFLNANAAASCCGGAPMAGLA